MFTLLLLAAFCGKLALSNLYLQQFNKVAESERGYWKILVPYNNAIYTKDICNANDEDIMRTNIPEQVCAEECFNAPYFCNSFLLGFQDYKLKCFHYGTKATRLSFLQSPSYEQFPVHSILLDISYEIKNEPDFVTTVAEISKKLINGPLGYGGWDDIVENYYTDPKAYDYGYVKVFGRTCEEAMPFVQNIDSVSEKQTLRLGNLDRKSFILALKKFHSPNPEYSPDFDKIVLIFLKWFQPRDCTFSDSHVFTIDPETENRVFVHSFSSGHYVTVTRVIDGYDHITYISADGSFGQKENNIHTAISKYLQSTDSLLGLADGTTELSLDPEEGHVNKVDLSRLGSTKAERLQQTAIAVVGHVAAALFEGEHVVFRNPFDATFLCDMITLVLSWAYKIHQSDFDMLGEAEILNRASKMQKTLFTGFSPDSVLDIITQR